MKTAKTAKATAKPEKTAKGETFAGTTNTQFHCHLVISTIKPDPSQPRKTFDPEEIKALAESMKSVGQLQPIQVYWSSEENGQVILFGERRWHAAKLLGWKYIRAEVVKKAERDVKISQLAENLQRSDVHPLEEGVAFSAVMKERGLTAVELAKAVGCSPSRITKSVALNDLEPEIREDIRDGCLTPAHGYELSRLKDKTQQLDVAHDAVVGKMGRDALARLVNKINEELPGQTKMRFEPPQDEAEPIVEDEPEPIVEEMMPDGGLCERAEEASERLLKPIEGFPREIVKGPPIVEEFVRQVGKVNENGLLSKITNDWRPEKRFMYELRAGSLVTVVVPGTEDPEAQARDVLFEAYQAAKIHWMETKFKIGTRIAYPSTKGERLGIVSGLNITDYSVMIAWDEATKFDFNGVTPEKLRVVNDPT